MCKLVVARFQHDNLEKRNMPRFFQTLKNFTEVATLAASGGFFSLTFFHLFNIYDLTS